MWLCESGNELIGCVGIVKRSETKAQLRWLLLEKKFRGKGIGRNLVKMAISYCRDDLKVKEIYLETIKGLDVVKLYESEGFKLVKENEEIEIWGEKRVQQMFELTL